jgi:hypothetical protein
MLLEKLLKKQQDNNQQSQSLLDFKSWNFTITPFSSLAFQLNFSSFLGGFVWAQYSRLSLVKGYNLINSFKNSNFSTKTLNIQQNSNKTSEVS